MTKSNATFNPSQLTGKIKDNLSDIDMNRLASYLADYRQKQAKK